MQNRNNTNNKLVYQTYRNCKDIITIDLHNRYTVIAIKTWNYDKKHYIVEFRITENTVDKWDLIQKLESIEFASDYKNINKEILRYVSMLFRKGFFKYYIDRYAYEINCFEIGNEKFERERLAPNVN